MMRQLAARLVWGFGGLGEEAAEEGRHGLGWPLKTL